MIYLSENPISLEEMLKKASQKLGTNAGVLKNAAKTGKINNLIKNLNTKDAQKVQKVLSDKQAASKLLSTPQAKKLLEKFLGEK